MRYLRMNSLTWWSGCAAIVTGVAAMLAPEATQLAELVALLAGTQDASPAGLIFLGLGLIGLRDRIERGFQGHG